MTGFRELRKDKGFETLAALAKATGINIGTLWRYENGEVVPKPERAEELGRALGVPGDVVRFLVKQANRHRREMGEQAS